MRGRDSAQLVTPFVRVGTSCTPSITGGTDYDFELFGTAHRRIGYRIDYGECPCAVTLDFRRSRYRVNPRWDDFPRHHPRTAARRRSGFADISRYGLVSTYPTRNFATLGPL